MHIAYLTPEYPHTRVKHSAGIGTSIKNLAVALVANGHDVTVFIYGQDEHAVFKEDGITMHLIKQGSYTFGGFYLYRKFLQRYINSCSIGIDLLEAPDWTGITAFCKFKIPHVIRLHGSDTYFCHLEGRKQKLKNFLFEKWALQGATAITSVSAFTATKTQELFKLQREIPVIHNMLTIADFTPVHVKAQKKYILNYGSVIRKKGVLALARAFNVFAQTHKTVDLVFLGKDVRDAQTGMMTSDLIKKELAVEVQSRVQFISLVPYDQVQDYVNKATVVCLPSYAEAFPMTWLEAMALEKPLITSDIGWAHELMISKKTGLTINPDDTVDFTAALKRMIDDPEFASTCGLRAREHLIANFATKDLLQKNMTFYNSLLPK